VQLDAITKRLQGAAEAGLSWGCSSGLLTRIAATESVSLWRADEKLTAFVELESAIRRS
jgi:hypothetical protein